MASTKNYFGRRGHGSDGSDGQTDGHAEAHFVAEATSGNWSRQHNLLLRRWRATCWRPCQVRLMSDGTFHPLGGTIYLMALNIKDPEVDRLADELAARMGHHNKTQAIRDALRAQLSLLEARAGDRVTDLLDVMRTEIWPLLPDHTPITRQEREQILGYDPETGV